MTDLAGRPGLGPKPGKPPKKLRKPVRKISAKRAAYLASAARVEGLAHMGRVKGGPCVCCGAPPPSEAHHCRSGGMNRDDMKVIPLCQPCHTGPNGRHGNAKAWHAKYGPDYGFLPMVEKALAT